MDEQESRKLQSSEPTVPALPTTEELEKLLNLAKQGNADAQNRLGRMYYDGEGVAKNYEEAARWLRQAAQQGLASAQFDLGDMYCDGLGVDKDYAQAVSWIRKAAEQGLPVAQNHLGTMYDEGLGVAQSYEESVKWYRKAAEQGDADGQYNLGCMYESGHGVILDYDEAIKWYQLAAENGDQEAEMAVDRIEAVKNLKEYSRNGQKAYLDPIRDFLVLKSPEETVRQKLLFMLQNKYKVPPHAIQPEYPLKKYTGQSKKRADIVIFSNQTPIMVIECKDEDTPLLDDVFDQCRHYADYLGCILLAITNGFDTKAYHNLNNKWQEITKFPSFDEMLQPYGLEYLPEEERRIDPLTYEQVCDVSFLRNFNDELWDYHRFCLFGEDTPDNLRPHIANLFQAVFASKNIRSHVPLTFYDTTIAEFRGTKYTTYSNASGGEFDGLYQGFRVVDSDENDQIYRIGFFGSLHAENDPKYGNLKGKSQIHVAIDNFDMSPHPSLILAFDKYMNVGSNSFSVNHDGRITVGNLGAAKRDLMIKYVKKHAPYLMGDNEHVHLGTFQTGKLLGFDDVKEFLSRIIKYAEIRDKFRMEYKTARKNGTALRL
jgi:hypothetical protein